MQGKKNGSDQIVVGVAWYRRDQWPRLLEIAEDAGELEKTYDEWLRLAEEKLNELKTPGILVKKTDVDLDEMTAWCSEHGRSLNAAARAAFVAAKVRDEGRARD